MILDPSMVLYIRYDNKYPKFNGYIYFINDPDKIGSWKNPIDVLNSEHYDDDIKSCILFEILHLL